MTRIALVIRGRASLGSYAAGACSELLLALERNRVDDPVVVDVVAGDGGGCFTAALVARTLVVNRNLLPWIERCWIDALDARTLFGAGGRPGLLDAAALDELSRGLIAADPATDDQPAVAFSDSVRIGFGGPVDRADDLADFTLTAQCGAGDPAWEDVRHAAVAGFEFPTSVPGTSIDQTAEPTATGFVGAPAIAHMLAERVGDDDERIFVVIDPAAAPVEGSAIGRGGGGGSAQDSSGRALLDALIARLPEIIDRLDDPGALALGRHVGDLAERAAELESGAEIDDERLMDLIDASLERIEGDPRWAPILARAESRSGRTRLAKLIYILQAACAERPAPSAGGAALTLISPAAPDSLECGTLGGLGGFFEQEWREADFRAGRRDARDAIESSLAAWIDYEPDDEQAYEGPATPARMNASAEARLRALVEADVERQLADVRVGGLAGLFGGWRNAVKKHAADRVLSSMGEGRS